MSFDICKGGVLKLPQLTLFLVKLRSLSPPPHQVHHHNGFRGTPEQEIIAFQKQLQNLPDFDSPEHPTGITDPALAAAEFLARGNLRPRSRSMPRVTYESSRFLALPDVGWSGRLPRGRSAGTIRRDRALPHRSTHDQISICDSLRLLTLLYPSGRVSRKWMCVSCIASWIFSRYLNFNWDTIN